MSNELSLGCLKLFSSFVHKRKAFICRQRPFFGKVCLVNIKCIVLKGVLQKSIGKQYFCRNEWLVKWSLAQLIGHEKRGWNSEKRLQYKVRKNGKAT